MRVVPSLALPCRYVDLHDLAFKKGAKMLRRVVRGHILTVFAVQMFERR